MAKIDTKADYKANNAVQLYFGKHQYWVSSSRATVTLRVLYIFPVQCSGIIADEDSQDALEFSRMFAASLPR